jgi:hypothetical protein
MDMKEKIHQMTFSRLGQYLAKYIPESCLVSVDEAEFSRRRLFSIENTFWGFFQQVLSADGGCQEIVNQFRVIGEARNLRKMSLSTSAYCQARMKLSIDMLKRILEQTQRHVPKAHSALPLIGRRVVVADGTGISMPDTAVNQKVWPQAKSQKEGCGFPQARICALFDLNTGVALSYRMGNKKSHELPLLRDQMDTFVEGDVFLGDKGFISYFDMLNLKEKGVDSVVGLAKRKPINASEAIKVLADDDLIVEWPKPKGSKTRYKLEEWENLPDKLQVRQIKVTVTQPGFRVKSFYIATTLLDETRYPSTIIAELYLKRWNVELYFRELKTTLGMDILRCKSPDMIQKEVIMYFIAFNAIKLMINDNKRQEIQSDEMSFNGCRQVLNALSANANSCTNIASTKLGLSKAVSKILSECKLLKRFGRVEPRVQKRRPKPFKLLTKPRAELKAELMGSGVWQTALT